MDKTLLLSGCGKMGGALLDGWLDRGISASSITIIEPNAEAASKLMDVKNLEVYPSPGDLSSTYKPDVIIYATKPQVMADVVPQYRQYAETGCVSLSIAAGKTIAFFESHLGSGSAIIRCMPNTPAAIRRGITVAYANPAVSQTQRTICQNLLEAVGDVLWIDDESLMDAVTAVSGSGPAYVFLLAEYLAEAGISAGLPADLAQQLARTTVAGSGELLQLSNDDALTLRENVTSPGGTTAAALDVLMAENGLKTLLAKAIAAATKRSEELAD